VQSGDTAAVERTDGTSTEIPLDVAAPRIPGRSVDWVRSVVVGGRSSLTIGLLFDGVASYVFLSAAARELGPDRFTVVSILWVVLFLVGNGLFIPVEQELSRSIATRAARGSGWSTLVRRVTAASAGVLAAAIAIGVLARGRIADSLFRGDTAFVALLLFGLVGVWLMFLLRGVLSGEHRFHGYGLMFAADGLGKAIPGIALLMWGVWRPSSFGFIVSGSAYVGIVAGWLALRWGRGRTAPGVLVTPDRPDVPPGWRRLTTSMGFLLLTSFLSALTINIGTVSIEVLGNRVDADKAGIFLSGLVIARIPLFLFQAIQAIVLPRLSHLAAVGDVVAFRSDLRRLNVAMASTTLAAVVGAAALGPLAVRVLFGGEYALLGARDMALLTLASMLMTAALTLNQAQIALHHQRQTGWPWGIATVAFLAVTATNGRDLFLRVELGMVAAGAVACVVVAMLVSREVRHPDHLRVETPTL